MKILVLSGFYPPHYHGGYELNCEAKINGLKSKGHDITILTSMYGVDRKSREGDVLRYLHPFSTATGGGLSRRSVQLKNAYLARMNYRIAKTIAEEFKPDLAYIWQMANVSIFPILAVFEKKIPLVYELGDYWLLQYKQDFVLEKSLPKRLFRKVLFGGFGFDKLDFTNMILVSDALKKSYSEGQFTGSNSVVIPAGVSRKFVLTARTEAAIHGEKEIRLLFAGRIVREKGVHIAIMAVSHLRNSLTHGKIRLDIIGNGDENYRNELNDLIHSLGLQDHVFMRAQISHHDLMSVYANHDVFLFPSIWEEPLGMTIIEAMAQGVPVVASRIGGVQEIIDNGRNGFLVKPGDPVDLAKCVSTLIGDMTLYSAICSAGVQTVLERFTCEGINDQTEKYLVDVLGPQ